MTLESTSEESCSHFATISFSQTLTLVPILKKTGISMNGNEPQAMSKDLILNNGCVVVHQDLFHSHGWHLPKKTIIQLQRPYRLPIYSHFLTWGDLFLDEKFMRNEQEECSAKLQENQRKGAT